MVRVAISEGRLSRMLPIGVSVEMPFSWHKVSKTVVVTVFVTEAVRKRVEGVTGSLVFAFRAP